ncbi:ferritin [Natronolimnohabitans innermongolicus]|uniref:Ferroxidase n=1 Tax=Natronolimnohabitans innermongolicus JCM 12255 TaxID=1227499 RepID=L9XAU5_9EURY|nr:ferritin [Natronolimnohabitans innermongolicus]ELY57743.1 ferroxidase [Natronolimnohabitans innermongolicus JCM 12255]
MLTEPIEEALNEQLNAELYSSYLYLSMAAYYEDEGLPGFASWMRAQADEENEHAMRIYDYVIERDGRVTLDSIDSPPAQWASPADAFEAAYEHEVEITAMIDDLVALAREETDNATENMLQWFVAEQVEEEATAQGILDKLKHVGDDGPGLLMIDQELGQRGGGGDEADDIDVFESGP